MTSTLWLDIETYSSVDLAKAGVYKYAESEDFTVLLFAYSYNDEPVKVIDLTERYLPWQIVQDLQNPDVIKKAHNAAFERVCLSRYLWRRHGQPVGNPFHYLDPEGWYCTMVHSSMGGLPQSLKQAGEALGLAEDQQKLTTGKALIKEFCQPCKPTKANGGRTRNLPEHDPGSWQTFISYNRRDVETEIAIEKRLEAIYPMPQQELERYWTDQRINDTGVRTDMPLVESILQYGTGHNESIKEAAQELAGINIGSPAQIKAWLKDRAGIVTDKLDKDTLPKLIAGTQLPDVQDLLRLRLEYAKTSNKKYRVIQTGTCQDGRMHGILQFYGSRTGRWAGRLLQPQNLPRNAFEDFHDARKLVKEENWELLEMCYPSPNDVFSTLIRTALIPAEGMAFAVADYSAIEARVIAWLADEIWRLEAFHAGKDIYCESASRMFKVPVEKHGVNGHLRKQGKVAELALGYSGGVGALLAFHADEMGLSKTEMQDIVDKWRKASPRICQLWKTLDRMVARALAGGTGKGPKGMEASMGSGFLRIKLPSGRYLIYQNPRYEMNPKQGRENLCFDGLNQTTHKWERVFTFGGKLTENVIQAIARDCLAVTIDRMQQYAPEARILMHVHDEIIVEVPGESRETWLQRILAVMAEPIDWAPGLELKGAGFTADYYMKD